MGAVRTMLAAAAVLALSACDRGAAPRPATPPAAATPAPPLTFQRSNPDAELSLKLPPQVAAIPALHAKLFDEGRRDLDAFGQRAKADLDRIRASGVGPARTYSRSLAYAFDAETPRLIGLTLTEFENTGGAHPNTRIGAVIWDKAAGRAIGAAELFRPGADLSAADKALCAAIRAAKRARTGEVSFAGAEVKDCPPLKDATLTLAPSTEPDRAGGLVALFSPYVLGPYVEGAYRIAVANAALQGLIAEPFEGEFAGEPAPGAGAAPSTP